MIKNYIQRDQYAGGGGGSTNNAPTTTSQSPSSNTPSTQAIPTQINESTAPDELKNPLPEPGTSISLYDAVNMPIQVTTTDSLELPPTEIQAKEIERTFGRVDDYIELHIYNNNGQLIDSDLNFTDYDIPPNQDCYPLTKHLELNPEKILSDRGFVTGKFKIKLNILKNKVFNTPSYPFFIKEISSDRREIKSISNLTTNQLFDTSISGFISDIESSVYFKEFSINLGSDVLIPCINLLLDKSPLKHELLLKTLRPLSETINVNNEFKIVEEIVDPISIDIDLGTPQIDDGGIDIQNPNFQIDIKQNQSIPSGFKTYDELLKYNVTSSYQHLLSKLEDDNADINIEYDFIRQVHSSSVEEVYHFENFTHFSSAVERLKNFKYKLKLIELYNKQTVEINSIPTTLSAESIKAKNNINTKKEKLIKGFDGYEQFLYFTSGTYAWPKQNSSKPYNLYSISSSQAKIWLGDERSAFPNYGGQLLSASLFDKQNDYALTKTIPNHILENTDNGLYVSFVNMVGQHFDSVWTYIKAISDIHNSSNSKGISKDLVYYQLKSLGIEAFDQFENASLTEYMLGIGSGSNNYNVGFTYGATSVSGSVSGSSKLPSETLVTASNESIAKGDIAKEIWKRIYHNASYLLKHKGTERGIKALMSCYGIPSTILNIKEYGGSTPVSGPLKDLDTADTYKTFTYQKSGLALKGDSGTDGFFIKTNWSSSLVNSTFADDQDKKSVAFRIKPHRLEVNQHLFTLSGSSSTGTNYAPANDQSLILQPYIGNDISSSGDSTQYGRIALHRQGSDVEVTRYFPIFNGDFWNVFITAQKETTAANASASLDFGAYQANFNKNISAVVTSSKTKEYRFCWGIAEKGAKNAFFGGVPSNDNANYNNIDNLKYSGSMQEIRIYVGEVLNNSTLKKQALEPFMYAGNSVSSSFNNLVLRLPLGSNDQQNSGSFHPNIDNDYLGMIDGASSSMSLQQWEEVIETHFLPTPDTVGASMTSEKVRIDTKGIVEDDVLLLTNRVEESTLDRQPLDYEDLGIFFSPTSEINEDILYTLGAFRMDDFIGSPLPSAQTSSIYSDLKDLKTEYTKKIKNKYNYWDYIKTIQYMDHTLFKIIEQFVPFRANLKTGLLIEPNFLDRNKIPRSLPVRSDGQTMEEGTHQQFEIAFKTNELYNVRSGSQAFGIANNVQDQWDPGSYVIYNSNESFVTSSKGERNQLGTNADFNIYDNYLDPFIRDKNAENAQASQAPIKPFKTTKPTNYIAHQSSVLLGNATTGKKSNKYYKYKSYFAQTSSLY